MIIPCNQLAAGWIRPQVRHEHSNTSGGVVVSAQLGPSLWEGFWQTIPLTRGEAQVLYTKLCDIQNSLGTFEMVDPQRAVPLSAPKTQLDGVTVRSVDASRLRLTGLPTGFKISIGDYVSIDDGTNLHLHRATSDATGSTYFTVMPAIRQAVAAGQAVTLRHPTARFRIVPDGLDIQHDGRHSTITLQGIEAVQ